MKLFEINKNVISGQCARSLARIQIRYTAIFVGYGLLPKCFGGGLQFGIFAPSHNPEIGYRCISFYGRVLFSLKGAVCNWPKWYKWLWKKTSFRIN